MKNVICCGFVAVVLALSAAASAQDHKMDDKMDKMKSETSYTGCIERSPDGAFTLGHAMAVECHDEEVDGQGLHGEGLDGARLDDEGSHGVDARPGKLVGRSCQARRPQGDRQGNRG